MFPVANPSQLSGDPGKKPVLAKVPEVTLSYCNLASVVQLRDEVFRLKHAGKCIVAATYITRNLQCTVELSEIIKKHVFVGIVDLSRCLSLIQHAKKLYLVNHGTLWYLLYSFLRWQLLMV